MARWTKDPGPKEVLCKWCKQPFQADAFETWEYRDNGDDKFEGWEWHTTCPACIPEPGTKQFYQRQYDDGFLTQAELEQCLKELK